MFDFHRKLLWFFLLETMCVCWYLFLLQCCDRPQACMQMSEAERQFCVSDLSGPTAGKRSVSALGHQSGFVNFLHTASQLLSPPQTVTSHEEVWGL